MSEANVSTIGQAIRDQLAKQEAAKKVTQEDLINTLKEARDCINRVCEEHWPCLDQMQEYAKMFKAELPGELRSAIDELYEDCEEAIDLITQVVIQLKEKKHANDS